LNKKSLLTKGTAVFIIVMFIGIVTLQTRIVDVKTVNFTGVSTLSPSCYIASTWKKNSLFFGEDYFCDNGRDSVFYKLHVPHAVHVGDQTFIGYMSASDGGPEVISYNHSTERWSDSVKVDIYSQGSGRLGPSLFINNNGYIWIIHGAHNSQPIFHVTTQPYDISSWESNSGFTESILSYPKPIHLPDDTVYVIFRQGATNDDRPWGFWKSYDGGDSWTETQRIIDGNAAGKLGEGYMWDITYQNGRIHMAWVDSTHSSGSLKQDLFYAYIDTSNDHMYNIEGTDLGPTISTLVDYNSCLVYDSSSSPYKEEVSMANVDVDEDQNPYIIFLYANANDGYHWSWNFTYWDGTTWRGSPAELKPVNFTEACVVSRSSKGSIDVISSTSVKAYISIARSANHPSGKHGGDVEEWGWDGASWSKNQTILSEDEVGGRCTVGSKIFNSSTDMRMVFSLIDAEAPYEGRGYAWGYNGFIKSDPNFPPNKPTMPSGQRLGKVGVEYFYKSNATDPEGDQVFYWFDWGDGTNSDWIGPYDSGQEIVARHTWSELGFYKIKVRAKDIYDNVSVWSYPFAMIIPKKTWLIGLINDLNESEDFTFFNASSLLSFSLSPFDLQFYRSDEQIIISNDDYFGFVGKSFVLGHFNIAVVSAE